MSIKTYREQSKRDWTRDLKEGESFDTEELQLGCLQRIADAAGAMAQNHIQLQKDREWYKEQYSRRGDEILSLHRQISSLKGVITKLKKKQAK